MPPFNDIDFQIDKCCENTRVIETECGDIVCTNCGLVHEEKVKKNEARSAYTKEEMDKRSTSAPLVAGIIPQIQVPKRGKGTVNDAAKWYRLSQINGQKSDRLRYNYYNKVRADCKEMNLPWYIAETAVKIFSECVKNKKLRGRCVVGMSKASVYYACVVNKFPMSIKSMWIDVDTRARMQTSLRFAREYAITLYGKNPDKGETLACRKSERIVKFCEMIERVANDAGVDIVTCKNAAKEIYSKIAAEKVGIMFVGKNPMTIIGALLFVTAKMTGACFVNKNGDKKHATQRVVSDLVNITEVSLRNRAKEIATIATRIRKRTGLSVHPLIDEYAVKYGEKGVSTRIGKESTA